jgi:hypothetical protein
VVKYRKIPPAAAANQIAENARIPPAADLQKNKKQSFTGDLVYMICLLTYAVYKIRKVMFLVSLNLAFCK